MSKTTNGLRASGWLSFCQMAAMAPDDYLPSLLSRGDGVYVWDDRGRRYLDALSGAFCVNVGYGRTRIIDAAYRASRKIHFASPFLAGNPSAVELAETLAELASPIVGSDARVFLVNSGSEAVDAAIKLARAYSRRTGRPNRYKVLARNCAYHGTTVGALSASGYEAMKDDFGPLMPGCEHGPHTLCRRCQFGLSPDKCDLKCASDLVKAITGNNEDHEIAAVLLEPFQNCGGNIPPPPGYWAAVLAGCRGHGVPLILDEVLTGFGRLGHWFAAERYGIEADIIACAKGLTSGYESLGAVIAGNRVADAFAGDESLLFHHGSTFGGRPGAAAAALENIAILREEGLLSKSREIGAFMRMRLEEQLQGMPVVGGIRGEGLLFGIDICNPATGDLLEDSAAVSTFHAHSLAAGIITCMRCTRCEPVLELAPPLITTREEVDFIVNVVSNGMEGLARSL